jgi:hypothetical protein
VRSSPAGPGYLPRVRVLFVTYLVVITGGLLLMLVAALRQA